MSEFSPSENPKNSLRQEALALRQRLPMESISQAIRLVLASWEVFQHATQVLVYYPFRGEVDLLPLVTAHPEKHWYLPVVPPHHAMEFYRYYPDAPLRAGKYGIAEPIPEGLPFGQADENTLILVPGVLFDRQGYRLGYGKGYYDRFLNRPDTINARSVGITPSALLTETLPHDPWDIPMRAIATDTGLSTIK